MAIKEISYGIVIVRDSKILLLRSFDHWDFPKGKPEKDETPLATALRETFEETSLKEISFPWGEEFKETEPYKKKTKVARYFVGKCDSGDVQLLPNPESGLVEHHEFRWLSIDEALELVKDRLKPILDWSKQKSGISNGENQKS